MLIVVASVVSLHNLGLQNFHCLIMRFPFKSLFFTLFQIFDNDSITTCLSSSVHYMVCELGFEKEANYAVNSFVTRSGEIYWKTIIEHVHYSKSGVYLL